MCIWKDVTSFEKHCKYTVNHSACIPKYSIISVQAWSLLYISTVFELSKAFLCLNRGRASHFQWWMAWIDTVLINWCNGAGCCVSCPWIRRKDPRRRRCGSKVRGIIYAIWLANFYLIRLPHWVISQFDENILILFSCVRRKRILPSRTHP